MAGKARLRGNMARLLGIDVGSDRDEHSFISGDEEDIFAERIVDDAIGIRDRFELAAIE